MEIELVILTIVVQIVTGIICGIFRGWYLNVAYQMGHTSKLWFSNGYGTQNDIKYEEGFNLCFMIVIWEIIMPFIFINWCLKRFVQYQLDKATGKDAVIQNPHGVKMGWCTWPINFDPCWIESCLFYNDKNEEDD